MSDPTPVNQTATNVVAVIKAGVGAGFDLAKAAIITQAPWLKIWGISTIFDFTLDTIETYVDKALDELGINSVIDVQVALEKAGVNNAKQELKAELVKTVPDLEAIAAAKAKFRASLGALIHFDGTATP